MVNAPKFHGSSTLTIRLVLCIRFPPAGIPIATPTAAPCCAKSASWAFEYAELSHGTRISLLPGILDAVDAGEIKISSLHNFCPLPMGVNYAAPNLYQFSASGRASGNWPSATR